MTDRLDIAAIGNAIVDVLAQVEDGFLDEHGIDKGVMQLIDGPRAAALYAAMPPAREASGGSAANTIAGAAALGARTAFVGKVADDQLGRIFAHDIRALGAIYDGPIAPAGGEETARSMVLVTPDGERSMNTYLGISSQLHPSDIDTGLIGRAEWLYLEGYLFDSPEAKQAYRDAIAAVRAGGGRVALSLSDPFCVERHHADFRRLIADEVDLLFANKAEALSLYRTDDLATAVAALKADVAHAAVTLSAEGALILRDGRETRVAALPAQVIDTTGAGDQFAAGFLAGLVKGADAETCGRMGCVAAAEVISHLGARPEADLPGLMARHGM